MSLCAFHLGQIISTVIGQVDHGGQDGNAARTQIPKTTLLSWCYLPNHKSFGYSEVLIWFRDGTVRGGH